MRDDRSFVWTVEFLVGTLLAGLVLNIVGVYVVRVFDRITAHLPSYFRRVRHEESARIQTLATAAMGDNALYAAVAAEAARFRSQQLFHLFVTFACVLPLLFLATAHDLAPAAAATAAVRVQTGLLITLLLPIGVFSYSAGMENGRRATRLDIALRAVHRDRALPIAD